MFTLATILTHIHVLSYLHDHLTYVMSYLPNVLSQTGRLGDGDPDFRHVMPPLAVCPIYMMSYLPHVPFTPCPIYPMCYLPHVLFT